MMRYICCPEESIPKTSDPNSEYISLYETSAFTDFDCGDVALSLKQDLRRSGIQPSAEAWDFCTIAMSVAAIDESVSRSRTVDGWTRVLDAEIYLAEPLIWQSQIPSLESTFRFLTGDFWKISLTSGGEPPPRIKRSKVYETDCVSLLSGGIDSLVGAIDLCRSGRKPLFVSKVVRGDKEAQSEIAARLSAGNDHVQWSFKSRSKSGSEASTRARSIVFFAYAALVASSLKSRSLSNEKVAIYVPENGFISLNLPLTPLRLGTHSTKTTHPVYLHSLQGVWDAVGIQAELTSPFNYRFRTKGEMMLDCLDIDLLNNLIGRSTSCGRYGRFNRTHCGRCVPCLIRRAAFLRVGLHDPTELSSYKGRPCNYVYQDLRSTTNEKSATDVRAAGRACLQVESEGIEGFIGGGLSFASPEERPNFVGVVDRGVAEIRDLLEEHRIL